MIDDTKPTEGDLYISPEEQELFDQVREELFDKVNDNLYIRKDEKEIKDPNEALYRLINTKGSSYEKYLEMVEHIDNINYQNKLFNCSFLHVAVKERRYDIIKDLLQRGIDLNLQDKKGSTALVYMLSHREWELFREVLKLKPNVNVKDNCGNNLLCKTIAYASGLEGTNILYDMVEDLLKMGTNPLSVNDYDKTPLQMAIVRDNEKLVELIKKYIKNQISFKKIEINIGEWRNYLSIFICFET